MASTRSGNSRLVSRTKAAPRLERPDDYWSLSSRPLHALVLLTPLVLLYEVGSLVYLTDLSTGTQQVIKAESLIGRFLQLFGVAGLLVPGLAMLTVLLILHVLSRDRWHVRPMVVVGMVLEAALWAMPLLVFGALLRRAAAGLAWTHGSGSLPALLAGDPGASLSSLPWQSRATVSLGAGLYEELLFRLVAIAALHFAAKDVLRSGEATARMVAIVGSALAFAFYHDVAPQGAGLSGVHWGSLAFYFAAGLYFATIYLFRGFGIVVAAHAIYDLIVLIPLAQGSRH